MLKKWIEHCSAIDRTRSLIEDIASQLPVSGSGKRLRQLLNDSWGKITDTTEDLDQLITAGVQPLPVKFPWQDKEFTDHWRLYKDYLQEQHGIIMKSRMEIARLKKIKEFCNDDRSLVIRSVDFYMASGSPNIFQVNFEALKKEEPNETQPIRVPIR